MISLIYTKKICLTKWVDVLELHGWRRCISRVWYGGNWPQGPYILWQVRFKTFLFFLLWFVFKKKLCVWTMCNFFFSEVGCFFCVGIITLTNIHMMEWCKKLFMVKLNHVDYYILKRFSVRKRLPMKNLRYVNSG